ncbi:MAG TPA: DUF2784 domain-containing protein [Burkholderiales bacterium]|nr:DUF2784 domain-containing protein [Burkholderiales bacterium]
MIADAVLVFHALFVLFVVGGLVLVLAGARRWGWVRNRAFRILHLAAIAFVTAEALLGFTCPLTIWDDMLRGGVSERSFIGRWVARLLYYDFPEWVFAAAYCVFALAVVWAWRAVPPRSRSDKAL